MGLVNRFVLAVDRRLLFAVTGVAVSVGYALFAGAAVGGLKDAQAALAEGLQDTDLVVVAPDMTTFDVANLPATPSHAIAVATRADRILYADLAPGAEQPGDARVWAGPALRLRTGSVVAIDGRNYTVLGTNLAPGAPPDGLQLDASDPVFSNASDRLARTAVYEDWNGDLLRSAQDAGFTAFTSPATLAFYVQGADELARTVALSVLASTAVVALLAAAFVRFEYEARRRSFATLRLFAGPGLVRRLVVMRSVYVLVLAHLLAIVSLLVLVRLLERAGALSLQLDMANAAGVVSATLGGGIAGMATILIVTRRRLHGRELRAAEPRHLPGPFRPILVGWGAAIPLAAATAIVAASLGVAFGVADIPFQIFGQDESDVIASTTGNPLRGEVDAFLGLHLADVPGFAASSPEIFAPTTIGGKPVMVRGVDWASLDHLQGPRILAGSPPASPGEAVLGEVAQTALGLRVGDSVVVPSSYHHAPVLVKVVGVARFGTVLDSNMVVPLETARALTGFPADAVNLVRFERDPAFRAETLTEAELPRGAVVTGLSMTPPDPVANQDVVAIANVTNFADGEVSRTLTLFVNGQPTVDATIHLPGRTEGRIELPFRVPGPGPLLLRVNPHLQTNAEPSAYSVSTPDVAVTASPFDVAVRTSAGEPAAGVTVTVASASADTGPDGRAEFVISAPGNFTALAQGPEGRGAATVLVVAPEDVARPALRYVAFTGPASMAPGPWQGTVTVENLGGAAFSGELDLHVDQVPHIGPGVTLGPGARGRVDVSLDLEAGRHAIRAGNLSVTVDVSSVVTQPPPTGTPTIEDLLAQRRADSRPRSAVSSDPAEAFLGDTYENFNAALSVIVLASLLHGGLVMVSAVERESVERASRVGALLAMGASRASLRIRAISDYGRVAVVACLIGTVLGLGLVWIGARLGVLTGFGHALVPRLEVGFVLRLWLANVALVLVIALLAIDRARARTVHELLLEGPSRTARPPLSALIEDRR